MFTKPTEAFMKLAQIDKFIVSYILPLGLFILLTGIHWIGRGGNISQTYIWLLFPSLICLMINLKSLKKWRPDLLELSVLAFFALAIASWYWSDTESSISEPIKDCIYIFTFIYAICRLSGDPDKLQKILIFSSIIAALGAAIALFNQYVILDQDTSYRAFRIYSMGIGRLGDFGNPIPSGIYFGAVASIIFVWICQESTSFNQTLIAATALTALLAYIVMTGSRGPQLAVIATFASACLIIRNQRTNISIALAVITAACTLFLFHEPLFSSASTDSTLSGRLVIWEQVFPLISNKFLLGHGYDASMAALFKGTHFSYTHNYFIQVLYNYGFIGFLLFSSMTITTLIAIKHHWSNTLAKPSLFLMIYGLTCMLTEVHRLIIHPYQNWLIFWLPIGLILGVKYSQQITTYQIIKTETYALTEHERKKAAAVKEGVETE